MQDVKFSEFSMRFFECLRIFVRLELWVNVTVAIVFGKVNCILALYVSVGNGSERLGHVSRRYRPKKSCTRGSSICEKISTFE